MKTAKEAIHVFIFNPQDNGGEQLSLSTIYADTGDLIDGLCINQELELQSYCNSVSLNLNAVCFTPENLRKLADELEVFRIKNFPNKV